MQQLSTTNWQLNSENVSLINYYNQFSNETLTTKTVNTTILPFYSLTASQSTSIKFCK